MFDLEEYHNTEWQPIQAIISYDALKIAIITTLEDTPNKSSTVKDIGNKVIKLLRIDTRSSPRKKFIKRANKALAKLVYQKAVIKYKATNERVKLSSTYNAVFARIKNNYSGPIQKQVVRTENSSTVTKMPLKQQDSKAQNDIIEDDIKQTNIEGMSVHEELYDEADDDIDSMLDELTGVPPLSEGHYDDTVHDAQDFENNTTIDDILTWIYNEYKNIDGISALNKIGEVRLSVNDSNIDSFMIINFLQDDSLQIKAYIPYLDDATRSLLKHMATNDYYGQLCCEDYGKNEHYVIRLKLHTKSTSKQNIKKHINNVILACNNICNIIESYL